MGYRKSEIICTDEMCAYGCGELAKYKSPSGILMCGKGPASCIINKTKNSNAVKTNYKETGRDQKAIYDGLSDETKSKMNWNKNNFNADFSYNGKGSHKLVLIKERTHKCECCNLAVWLDKSITLELEHIDGDNRNNNKDNLMLLCPNCHSYTDTWRGRNINSGKIKVTDDELILAISNSVSIRQALLSVGLTAKGGNYVRCNDMIHGGLVKLVTTSVLRTDASA